MENLATHKDSKKPVPRLLLVDDDPVFCKVLAEVAKRERIPIVCFTSVKEAYAKVRDIDFDIALLDYDLGPVTGVQLANFIVGHHQKGASALLVSNLGELKNADFPSFIKSSVNKHGGAYKVLVAALEQFDTMERKKTITVP